MPFGLFFGRLANFVNGELWGGPTDLPWAMRLPAIGGESSARAIRASSTRPGSRASCCSPILWFMFWKTRARYQPGKLVGAFILVYGISRFLVEFVREPDAHLVELRACDGLQHGPVAVAADDPRRPLSGPDREAARRARVRPVAGR